MVQAKIFSTLQMCICLVFILLSGCVTQSFEDNEPVVKTQANRDEMAATRISLGLGYLKMGNMSQAKLNLEKAKRFSPKLVQVHTAFAHFYETVGENSLAIASFEAALAIKADSADTLNNYGVFLCRQNQVDAAEEQFLKAIAVPTYLLVAQSYENLASCYLQNDNFEKAEMYLNKTIAHSPNRTQPLLQMVRLKYAMGNFKQARVYLQKFDRNTQRFSADSLALSYKVYRKLGQRRTANNYGNMLVKMYPQSWEGKQFLLNGLEFIEADNLANRYQLSQKRNNVNLVSTPNKRLVKLSPKLKSTGATPKAVAVKATTTSSSQSPLTTQNTQNEVNASNTMKTAGNTVTNTGDNVSLAGVSSSSSTTTPVLTSVTASSVSTTVPNEVGKTILLPVLAYSTNNDNQITTTQVTDTADNLDSIPVSEKAQAATLIVANKNSKNINNKESVAEPTWTKPIPAQRDVPLPEALPDSVENKSVETKTTKLDKPNQPVVKIDATSAKLTFHTVVAGENLYNISVKYNTKISTLRRWNNISEKNTIRVDQKLYVVDPSTVKNGNE